MGFVEKVRLLDYWKIQDSALQRFQQEMEIYS